MVFSAIVASPITSFTMGTAGTIYASDFVSLTLIVCWTFPTTRKMMFYNAPLWYKSFFAYIVIACISIICISPFLGGNLAELGLTERVRNPLPFIPLPVLMAGFRLSKIFLYIIFFSYAVYLVQDNDLLRFTYKCIAAAVTGLAICQIITYTGIKDLGLYLPYMEYQEAHIVGHAKAAGGRLYIIGFFVCLVLIYRFLAAPVYMAMLAVIIMGLLFNGSRAAFLGIVAGLLIFSLRGKFAGKFVGFLTVILLIIGFSILSAVSYEKIQSFAVIAEAPSENPRWSIWKWNIIFLLEHLYFLLTGVGFANFRYALASEGVAEHGHNDYLTCLTEIGVVGLSFFLMYIIRLFRLVNERIKEEMGYLRWEGLCLLSVLTAFLISSMFEPSLYYSQGAMCMQRIFAVLFGASTACWHQQKYMENIYCQT